MTENQIKVNNIDELINKAKEYAVSQGGAEKVSIGKTCVMSDTYTYTKGKAVPTKKGGIKLELKGENGSSAEFFWETNDKNESEKENKDFFSKEQFKIRSELIRKVLAELKKIIPDKRSTPPQKSPNEKDNFQPHSWSAVCIPCSSLQEVKEQINKYYQENKEAITQNPDFSRWIDITEISIHDTYSEVDKNGKTISEGPYNTATIVLQGQDRKEDEKIVNKQISLLLKVKADSEEWLKEDFEVLWPEKELKNYWNSLVGKTEPKSNSNSDKYCSQCSKLIPGGKSYFSEGKQIYCSFECQKKSQDNQKDNPKNSDKNNQNEIKKLHSEIKELEEKLATDNSENTKKELE
ncbi:MAG: hypothetical protein I3274_06960, partial [Candidatus Moeniiplasma glomeromycotorum]|nr:hypothetical protein [Candidatus Moeniiplasma glomeromycotorum]